MRTGLKPHSIRKVDTPEGRAAAMQQLRRLGTGETSLLPSVSQSWRVGGFAGAPFWFSNMMDSPCHVSLRAWRGLPTSTLRHYDVGVVADWQRLEGSERRAVGDVPARSAQRPKH